MDNKEDRHLLYLLLGFFFHLALAITLRWYTNLGLCGLWVVMVSVMVWVSINLINLNKETKLEELKGSLDSIVGYWEHPHEYWEHLYKLNNFEKRYRPIKRGSTATEGVLYG